MKIEGDTITFKSTSENFKKELMNKTNTVRKFYVNSSEYDEFLKHKSKLKWINIECGDGFMCRSILDICPCFELYDYENDGYLMFKKMAVWVFSW